MPWSPAPTSISSLPTCTPPAMSGLCLLMRTSTSQVLSLKQSPDIAGALLVDAHQHLASLVAQALAVH